MNVLVVELKREIVHHARIRIFGTASFLRERVRSEVCHGVRHTFETWPCPSRETLYGDGYAENNHKKVASVGSEV
jgi:hypothetical protein